MKRFDLDADSVADAAAYFRNRAFQLLVDRYTWSGEVTPLVWQGETWGASTTYVKDGEDYHSIYVLASHRGKGHMKRCLPKMAAQDAGFVTTGPCQVFELLEKFVDVDLVGDHQDWAEYKQIARFYGDRKAKRSELFLMNHVDEGIAILSGLPYSHTYSHLEQAAFMLHPLMQRDEDFAQNFPELWADCGEVDERAEQGALVLAAEYRNIANQFLSPMENHPGYEDHEQIALSPLSAVNRMLVADKIQNYKDFKAHHTDVHPRSMWLNRYFTQWFKRLGVSMDDYNRLSQRITVPETSINKIPLAL